MMMAPKKVKILEWKPFGVKLEVLTNGKIISLPIGVLRRKLDMGLMELVNPEKWQLKI